MELQKLNPGCMIAWAFDDMARRHEEFTIEALRSCMESAPTWPETWTRQQGIDYVRAFLNKA